MKPIFVPDKHYKTKNSRGFMHPRSKLSNAFIDFSKTTSPVIDMGCAYGNTVITALAAGAEAVIACDMEKEHLDILLSQVDAEQKCRLTTAQGKFPQDFNFSESSIGAIHASLLLAYLNGDEVELGLQKFFNWLKPGGKVFILLYSIYIKELMNEKFIEEYNKRIANKVTWPGYLEDFNQYSFNPDDNMPIDNSAFPLALHFIDLPILVNALESIGFSIEVAEYLNGRDNGAVSETWYDGREYISVIAKKPFGF